jgi:hypothetical protein
MAMLMASASRASGAALLGMRRVDVSAGVRGGAGVFDTG